MQLPRSVPAPIPDRQRPVAGSAMVLHRLIAFSAY